MPANRANPEQWDADTAKSVDLFNEWFIAFAPKAFRETRIKTAQHVEIAMGWTENMGKITPDVLREHPNVLQLLRMAACPPIARDRLSGLSGAWRGLVGYMEVENALPPKMSVAKFNEEAQKIIGTIQKLIDPDVFPWLQKREPPNPSEVHRAATIVADRLCGALADPIIRNAQESRQLSVISKWLETRGYLPVGRGVRFDAMAPGTYGFRMNVR